MIGSNFSYKDQKSSVELTSVFDLILNSPFSKNGAKELPKSELHKIIFNLKDLLSKEFIYELKIQMDFLNAHKGEIYVKSFEDNHNIFGFTLPIIKEAIVKE